MQEHGTCGGAKYESHYTQWTAWLISVGLGSPARSTCPHAAVGHMPPYLGKTHFTRVQASPILAQHLTRAEARRLLVYGSLLQLWRVRLAAHAASLPAHGWGSADTCLKRCLYVRDFPEVTFHIALETWRLMTGLGNT